MLGAAVVDLRLRRALLALAGFMFLGTAAELWLLDHTEDLIQLIPFVLCGLGVVAVVGVWLSPQRTTVAFLRGVMLLVIAGSLLGMYEHVAGNYAFELEIRPNATAADIPIDVLKGGNPIIAPGMLAIAGMIALLATYYHPRLMVQNSENVTAGPMCSPLKKPICSCNFTCRSRSVKHKIPVTSANSAIL